MSKSKRLRCNSCGELSYNGSWRGHRWFCSDCQEYKRISEGDQKGSKRKRGIPNEKNVLDLLFKKTPEEKLISQVEKLRSLPSVHKKYGQYISKDGVFKVRTRFNPHSDMIDGGELREYYREILKNKVLKNDSELMNDIIKWREKLMRHRMSCAVFLYEKGKVVAILKVYQILIEQGQKVVDYWVGKSIDPSSFNTLIADFKIYIMQVGAGNSVAVNQYPFKWHTIDSVEMEFEFA